MIEEAIQTRQRIFSGPHTELIHPMKRQYIRQIGEDRWLVFEERYESGRRPPVQIGHGEAAVEGVARLLLRSEGWVVHDGPDADVEPGRDREERGEVAHG